MTLIWEPVVFSLGSNVGDSLATLQGAVDALSQLAGVRLEAVSSVYRTAPWGGVEQDDFLNVVVVGRTSLEPLALLDRTQAIENEFGRRRLTRWGPRTLDIDLVWVGPRPRTDERLTLPHPRAHERAFVLVPWAEVAPDADLPGHGSISAIGERAGVERLTDVKVVIP